MAHDEPHFYPTDELKAKYVTVLEASQLTETKIATIIDLIKEKKIPYAEFAVKGARSRVIHVNPDDVRTVMKGGTVVVY